MTYDPDFHHRRSIRLKEYDYSSCGAYFMTICAQGRESLFGEIVDGRMRLNDAGRLVAAAWNELPVRFPHVSLDEFVVMPNHVHGIVEINDVVGALLAAPIPYLSGIKPGAASSAPTLGTILRMFKSLSAIGVNRLLQRNERPLWQRNYYDRVIRNENELAAVREYIRHNPSKWEQDEENPANSVP